MVEHGPGTVRGRSERCGYSDEGGREVAGEESMEVEERDRSIMDVRGWLGVATGGSEEETTADVRGLFSSVIRRCRRLLVHF